MSDIFSFADDIGPEKIIQICDPTTGLRAVVVIDNVASGPAIGGTRMALDVSVEECFRLARAMTFKNATASLPHGGAKAVIFGDPKVPPEEKERLIRSFAHAIADIKDYIPGPDMGTDETCMAWIHDMIGRSVGLPREIGGIPLDEIGATGFGLTAAIDVAKEFVNLDLAGARLAVQGFGCVGSHTARFLAEKGATLIAAADSRGTILNENGLNIEALAQSKQQGASVVDSGDGEILDRDAIIDIECDIWIPSARPDVINETNVDRLKTQLVAEGANIPVTLEAERRLAERGILVLPDFVANAGGVICAAVEYAGGTQNSAFATIDEKIRSNIFEVLKQAKEDRILPREAAEQIAKHRVLTAMEYRKTY